MTTKENNKKFYIGYAIEMSVGDKHSYVFETNDIEDGGFVDLEPDWLIPTDTEANQVLAELQAYCDEKGYKNVILCVEGVEDFGEVDDVELMKGSYNTGDTLSWSYNGKDYSCTGEFYIDDNNMLHHTFFAPSGKEIEIVTPYE